jgi:hypothetical protein
VAGSLVSHEATVIGSRDLARMATEQDMEIQDDGPDGPVYVTHWEVGYRVSFEAHWQVWFRDRDDVRVLGTFSDRDAALKFLVMQVGATWRSLHGHPPLRGPGSLGGDAEIRRVEWTGGWAEFPKGASGGFYAADYELLVDASPDASPEDVAAAFAEPSGRPLFGA